MVGFSKMTVVGVRAAGTWVAEVGGAPAAGNLQEVTISPNITKAIVLMMILLFMSASLNHCTKNSIKRFYIILGIDLGRFFNCEGIYVAMLSVIYPDGCHSLQGALALADTAADAHLAEHTGALHRAHLATGIHYLRFL